jgi:hypothetical protein
MGSCLSFGHLSQLYRILAIFEITVSAKICRGLFFTVLNSNTVPVKATKQYGFRFHYTRSFTFFLLFKYLYAF